MPRTYKNPHGYVIDKPEFVYRPRIQPGWWWGRGNCQTEKTDPETFFSDDKEWIKEAEGICKGCPIRLQCLILAIRNHEQFGVWGGVRTTRRIKKFQGPYNLTGRLPSLCIKCREPYMREGAEMVCKAKACQA